MTESKKAEEIVVGADLEKMKVLLVESHNNLVEERKRAEKYLMDLVQVKTPEELRDLSSILLKDQEKEFIIYGTALSASLAKHSLESIEELVANLHEDNVSVDEVSSFFTQLQENLISIGKTNTIVAHTMYGVLGAQSDGGVSPGESEKTEED